MKISSKLVIGLLSTIFLIMSAMFIDVRLFGLHGNERYTKNYTDDFPIDNFRHLILENAGQFTITKSDRNYIQFVTISDTLKSTIQYRMDGDTLKISGHQSTHYSNYTLFTNAPIESITSKDSEFRLMHINQDSIKINVDGGELSSYGNPEETSHIKNVKIIQANSRVQFDNIKIDTLNIEMEKSNARFGEEIQNVKASIHSMSELNLKNTGKLELEKDESSQIRFW